jgi:hypothetical protein
VDSFRLDFPQMTYMRLSSPHSCYISRPYHPPRLAHSDYTWRRVQIMKHFIMRNILFSTLFSNILSVCSPLMSEAQFHTHTEPQRKNFHIPIFTFLAADEKTQRSALNGSKHRQNSTSFIFLRNQFFICYCCSQIFEP